MTTDPNEGKSLFDALRSNQTDGPNKAKLVHFKDEFLLSLVALYSDIKQWLSPGLEEGLVHIENHELRIEEELLGVPYAASAMRIIFPGNNRVVDVIPVGAFIVGARGRVDLRSGVRERILLRVEREDKSLIWCMKLPSERTRGASSYPLLTEDRFLVEIKQLIF